MTDPAQPASRRRARTGSGATINIDNIAVHYVVLAFLAAAIVGGGTGSIEGLWHVAGWFEPDHLQWTLPMAVDVFLVGLAILSLVFRRRRRYLAAVLAAIVTVALVTFSSWANYTYQAAISDTSTPAGQFGPWLKASLPFLLLLGIEFAAALLSTKSRSEKSALAVRDQKIRAQKTEIVQLKKRLRSAGTHTESIEVTQ